MDLFMQQLEYNAIHDKSSGLGYLTMLNDYQAKLSWSFKEQDAQFVKTICRVELQIH